MIITIFLTTTLFNLTLKSSQNTKMSNENDGDDLEQTLMLAAADADARSNEVTEVQRVSVIKAIEEVAPPPRVEVANTVSKKRRHGEIEAPKPKQAKGPDEKPGEGYASVVANHYNNVEEKGLQERSKSRIVYLRNFHNWIKSMLINEAITKIKDNRRHNSPLRVMDMCCGKGGDLLKWRKGGISHLICTDIASVSLDQCKSRYEDMKTRRDRSPLFSIEYIPADCTRVRLREKYKDPSMKLDLVSCQFAFHYSFESLPQAECMFRNASECIQAGGYFIGTMPDSNELVARAQKAGSNSFKNDILEVSLDFDIDKPDLFGAKYNFQLDGRVDCPEFLVHFPTFVELGKKYGLRLVSKEKFYNYFERMKNEGRNLLSNMKSLETYPCNGEDQLVGTATDDYKHADDFLAREGDRSNQRVGTLSKSEWEASSLYLTFFFEKVKNTWNADGTPKFEF